MPLAHQLKLKEQQETSGCHILENKNSIPITPYKECVTDRSELPNACGSFDSRDRVSTKVVLINTLYQLKLNTNNTVKLT